MSRQTQRFSGKTLETAILAAINELGEDAHVLDARRVRRGGVAGFFASEHYVVTAQAAQSGDRPARREAAERREAPAAKPRREDARAGEAGAGRGGSRRRGERAPQPAAASRTIDGPVFADHLRQLVDAVEAQEQVVSRVRPASVPREPVPVPQPAQAAVRVSPLPRFFSDDELAPLAPARPQPVTAAPHRSVDIDLTDAERGAAPAAQAGPTPDDARRQGRATTEPSEGWMPWHPPVLESDERATVRTAERPATAVIDLRPDEGDGGPRWSLEALRALGVPESILDRLPPGLVSDLAWTTALEAVIRELIPPPADPRTPTTALTVSGPAAAAPRLLQAAVAGYPLGELQLAERRVRATAFELTLAVRACLLS